MKKKILYSTLLLGLAACTNDDFMQLSNVSEPAVETQDSRSIEEVIQIAHSAAEMLEGNTTRSLQGRTVDLDAIEYVLL